MRFVAGWFPFDSSQELELRPRGSSRIHSVRGCIWASSLYRTDQIRTIAGNSYSLTIVGTCFGTNEEVKRAAEAGRRGSWHTLMSFPGAYMICMNLEGSSILIGSLSGLVPIYFARTMKGYLWANAAMPLASYIGSSVDTAVQLSDMSMFGIQTYSVASLFERVECVTPGYLLEISGDSHKTRPWHKPRLTENFDTTAKELHAAFSNAISARMTNTSVVSADFSGGLDSGTIAAFASTLGGITGMTYAGKWADADDTEYSTRIAAECPNLNHLLIPGSDDTLHFSRLGDLSRLSMTDSPSNDVMIYGMDSDILDQAIALGSELHMTGAAGDILVDAESTYIAHLLQMGHRKEALKRGALIARSKNTSLFSLLRAMWQLAHTSYPSSLMASATLLKSEGEIPPAEKGGMSKALNWCVPLGIANWFTREARERAACFLEARAAAYNPAKSSSQFLDWCIVWNFVRMTQFETEEAAKRGIQLDHPFLDTQMLDLCLSLADYRRARSGEFKPLLKTAMKGLVPGVLLNRTTKGHMSNDFRQGVIKNRTWLQEIVHNSRLVAEGLVDPALVLEEMERIVSGVVISSPSLVNFVTNEIWLQKLDLRVPTWWEDNK